MPLPQVYRLSSIIQMKDNHLELGHFFYGVARALFAETRILETTYGIRSFCRHQKRGNGRSEVVNVGSIEWFH